MAHDSTSPLRRWSVCVAAVLYLAAIAGPAAAQTGSGPELFFDGTIDLAATMGGDGAPEVHELIRGDSPFDPLRFRVFFDVRLHPRVTVFNQFLIDPSISFGLETFLRTYVRVRALEFEQGDLHFQAGTLPTPFGSFGSRSYSDENPLISTPFMYHYFSSLRSDQLPADNADLLAHRGEGLSREFGGFTGGGSTDPNNGMPMIYDACWDTGVAVVGSLWRFEWEAAVTRGTLSAPRIRGTDNNDGQQVALRLGFVPSPSLFLGASFARGPYLDSVTEGGLGPGVEVEDFAQTIYGFDVEYGWRHLQLIGEVAFNRWESPNITDAAGRSADLTSFSWYLEGKYTLSPGLFVAARWDDLDFGKIDDGTGTGTRVPWDHAIDALEVGVGYYFTDLIVGKLIRKEYRTADPGRSPEDFWAAQLSASF